ELRVKSMLDFFGDKPLRDINLGMIQQYRDARKAEGISLSTRNLAVGFLRYLLNLAADHDVLESVPRIKLHGERKEQSTVTDEEYAAILAQLDREQQRLVVVWRESALRHREALNLTWSMVDFKAGLLRLPGTILKEKNNRRVPITHELRVVLEELKSEQSKV